MLDGSFDNNYVAATCFNYRDAHGRVLTASRRRYRRDNVVIIILYFSLNSGRRVGRRFRSPPRIGHCNFSFSSIVTVLTRRRRHSLTWKQTILLSRAVDDRKYRNLSWYHLAIPHLLTRKSWRFRIIFHRTIHRIYNNINNTRDVLNSFFLSNKYIFGSVFKNESIRIRPTWNYEKYRRQLQYNYTDHPIYLSSVSSLRHYYTKYIIFDSKRQ